MGYIQVQPAMIESLRATLGAALAQLEAIAPQVTVEREPEPRPAAEPSDVCLHENRQSAARMGAPHAWYCPDCHEQGDK